MRLFNSMYALFRQITKDAVIICLDLFRFIIPLVILVKILMELGAIEYVAMPLKPIMALVGLPPELGLAWAAGMLVNIYTALLMFLTLLPGLGALSVAQVTVFGLMLLMAHSLILETRVAGQAGVNMPLQVVIRVVVAIIAGGMFHLFCVTTGAFAETANVLLEATSAPTDLVSWALREIGNLGKIFVIVWFVMLLQKGIDKFNITYYFGIVLHPFLRMLGISADAATTLIVGFCMGILYGSGVILRDAREGRLSKHDIFCSMTIMGVAHALIEDTLLMMLLGASLWGLLLWRLVVALTLGVVANIVYARLRPEKLAPAG